MTLLKNLVVALSLVLTALAGGAACGLAGRVVYLLGLYDVAAALGLGAAAVTLCHLARWRIGWLAGPAAVMMASTWLCAAQVSDAWAFRQEQGQWLQSQPLLLAQDLAVAGVDDATALVDAGLRAETGRDGVAGAWMAQNKAGIVVQRALGSQRVLPASVPVRAAALGAELAFVALLVWRALAQLQHEPRCPTCGRFLRRTVLARVGQTQADALQRAWAANERAQPTGEAAGVVAVVYQDDCAGGHLAAPGLALVAVRRHSSAMRPPGPVAVLPGLVRSERC